MSAYYTFSEEVRRSRIRLGITQEEAAEALSISVRYFQYIEAGKRMPTASLKLRIIALLGMNGENLQEEE